MNPSSSFIGRSVAQKEENGKGEKRKKRKGERKEEESWEQPTK